MQIYKFDFQSLNILEENLGIEIIFDDELGKYTVKQALFNAKLRVKSEIAMMSRAMTKASSCSWSKCVSICLNLFF